MSCQRISMSMPTKPAKNRVLYSGFCRVRASARRQHGTYAVGQVAQLVEHMTENHGVGGSIPSLATSLPE